MNQQANKIVNNQSIVKGNPAIRAANSSVQPKKTKSSDNNAKNLAVPNDINQLASDYVKIYSDCFDVFLEALHESRNNCKKFRNELLSNSIHNVSEMINNCKETLSNPTIEQIIREHNNAVKNFVVAYLTENLKWLSFTFNPKPDSLTEEEAKNSSLVIE